MSASRSASRTRGNRPDLDVEGVLGPHGALAAVLETYEHRPEQLALAAAVERALCEGQVLLAEAGTGTGKTLAYLVPAVLSGKRVVVSTATRTLQEQLFQKDLPLLRDRVGLKFSAALLKGRANYLCALKFDHFERAPTFESPQEATHWPAFLRWTQQTRTGDRSETRLPDGWGAWPRVSTTSETCLGRACPSVDTCHVTLARRAAENCQVIVVNHALFFSDLALRVRAGDSELGVLPAYDAVIFDEAHALEDVATEHFGRSVSAQRLEQLTSEVQSAVAPLSAGAGALTALCLEVRARSQAFFQEVATKLGVASQAGDRERGSLELRLSAQALEEVLPSARALSEALRAVMALCPAEDPHLGGPRRRASELAETVEHILRADDESQVFWAQIRSGGLQLRSAPINVGQELARHLYDTVDAVIFTSATLTTAAPTTNDLAADTHFAFVAKRLGLAGSRLSTVRVESPFDYPSQAALYVPEHLPEPADPQWTRELAREALRLVRLTGGRAFLLFTSHRHLDEVHALLAPHLDHPSLKQGDAPRHALLEAFRAEPSVLFASQSFWEGVDVPGDALSLVVIDRLPFVAPGAPLQAARIDAARTAGLKPFHDFQVPQAALSLRQGFGRLIRSRQDRGIVALGDPRIVRRSYGAAFFESLPPARRFSRLEEVKAWWEHAP